MGVEKYYGVNTYEKGIEKYESFDLDSVRNGDCCYYDTLQNEWYSPGRNTHSSFVGCCDCDCRYPLPKIGRET